MREAGWDAFDRGEEIFHHNIAELAVRNVLDIIGCDIGNLTESRIPCQRMLFAVKSGFIFIIDPPVCFIGSAVLIGRISCGILIFRLNHKLKAGFFGESLQDRDLKECFFLSACMQHLLSLLQHAIHTL